VENAQAAGAVGAVIFNEGTIGAADRNDVLIPTLAGYDATIPVVGTDYATGRSLVDLVNGGTTVTLRVKVDGFINEGVTTNNVIAETPGGRSDRTVVVGGHLDSVYAVPGINDDGSGVSTMLETAEEMHELGITPRTKVRFIFFSGEEQGLLGSDYYVSQLTKKQIQDISVMLDFDMLASPNYGRSSTTAMATSTASQVRTALARSSRCSRTSGTAKIWRTRRFPSTGAPTTTPLRLPESRPAVSSPAQRSKSSRTRSTSMAATPVCRSTSATTSSATR
jgi:Zn-dependent M28 family amino/carboxypeptidase